MGESYIRRTLTRHPEHFVEFAEEHACGSLVAARSWRHRGSGLAVVPGCVSQGQTRAEVAENVREAIEGYLMSLRKHGDPLPPSILEEVIEVAGG